VKPRSIVPTSIVQFLWSDKAFTAFAIVSYISFFHIHHSFSGSLMRKMNRGFTVLDDGQDQTFSSPKKNILYLYQNPLVSQSYILKITHQAQQNYNIPSLDTLDSQSTSFSQHVIIVAFWHIHYLLHKIYSYGREKHGLKIELLNLNSYHFIIK
jgi:hypothetical protein